MKILAVGDDPVFRSSLESMLRECGISDVSFVNTGAKALKIVQSAIPRFDCIFADVYMPEMDGIELTSIIRAIDPSRDTQIVMVTAVSNRHYIDRAFHAGADDYIGNPLDKFELKARLSSIARFLNERAHSRSLQDALKTATAPQHLIGFEDAVSISGSDGMMTSSQLVNYLTSGGQIRDKFDHVVAFSIENAANIFVRTNDEQYLQILAAVGDAISSAFPSGKKVLGYLGCGNFIAMLAADARLSSDDLETQIKSALTKHLGTTPAGCTPIVRVGEASTKSFFSRRAIDEVVENALQSARSHPATRFDLLRKCV